MAVKRLSKVARELNVGISTIVDFLATKGVDIDGKPNTKIEPEVYSLLSDEFQSEKSAKEESKNVSMPSTERESVSIEKPSTSSVKAPEEEDSILITNVPASDEPKAEAPKEEKPAEPSPKESDGKVKVVGKIDLDSMNLKTRPDKKSKKETEEKAEKEKKEKETFLIYC